MFYTNNTSLQYINLLGESFPQGIIVLLSEYIHVDLVPSFKDTISV